MTSDLEVSQEEISTARDPRWSVVGVAGTHLDSLTVLKLAFGNGETEIMSLDDAGIRNLIAVLRTIVPNFDTIAALPVGVNFETGRTTASSSA